MTVEIYATLLLLIYLCGVMSGIGIGLLLRKEQPSRVG